MGWKHTAESRRKIVEARKRQKFPRRTSIPWISTDPRYRRDAKLRRLYGITLDEKEAMIMKQKGLCFVCEEQMKVPQTEHDHDSGRVTAMVCPHCNYAVEWVRKYGERIQELIQLGRESISSLEV